MGEKGDKDKQQQREFITRCREVLCLAEQALNDEADGGRAAEMARLLKEIKAEGLKTNDLIVLSGDSDGGKVRELSINGSEPLPLKRREFLFLLVLARERKAGGGFLSVNEILDRIQNMTVPINVENGLATDGGFWSSPSYPDIYTLVSGLRNKLFALGRTPDLIENSTTKGGGYRLSTSSTNVSIQLSGDREAFPPAFFDFDNKAQGD